MSKLSRNMSTSNGFTLIEIIASIAILGMVIAVFLPIFPQIMVWNNNAEQKLVAGNLLNEAVNEAKSMDVIEFIDDDINSCNDYLQEEIFLKNQSLNNELYEIRINVCKENEVDLYRTNIRIYSTDDQLISETYTYLEGDANE